MGGICLDSSWIELSPVLRALPSFVFGCSTFSTTATLVSPTSCRQASSWAVLTAGLIVAMVSGVSQPVTLLIVYVVAIAAVAADSEVARL